MQEKLLLFFITFFLFSFTLPEHPTATYRVIVIDAGHYLCEGDGCTGDSLFYKGRWVTNPDGRPIDEIEQSLLYAFEYGAMIEKYTTNIIVVYTRTTNVICIENGGRKLSIWERSQIINNADRGFPPLIVISFHSNAEKSCTETGHEIIPTVYGTETYYTDRYRPCWQEKVTYRHPYREKSELLAGLINTYKIRDCRLYARYQGKPREANYGILRYSQCPVVLSETGFHSFKEELARIKDPRYRYQYVAAHFAGVLEGFPNEIETQDIDSFWDSFNGIQSSPVITTLNCNEITIGDELREQYTTNFGMQHLQYSINTCNSSADYIEIEFSPARGSSDFLVISPGKTFARKMYFSSRRKVYRFDLEENSGEDAPGIHIFIDTSSPNSSGEIFFRSGKNKQDYIVTN